MVRAILDAHRSTFKALPVFLVVALTWTSVSAAPLPARPATDAPCEITESVVWTAAESPYVADCVIRIRDGGYLTVESGTTVEFTDRGGISVDTGALKVNGASKGDVEFTSAKSPAGPGDWRGVEVGDNGSGEFHGLRIRYAGQGQPALTFASITNTLGLENNTITDSIIEENTDDGLRIEEVNAIVRDVELRENRGDGIFVADTKDSQITVELTRVEFEDNQDAAVSAEANVQFTLDDNSASGNGINAISTSGRVLEPVVWPGGDLPFVLDSNITIEADVTIRPNTVVKATRNAGLNVTTGRLDANGSESELIYFTTVTDDDACTSTKVDCDTESDGPGSQLPGSWSRITFSDKSAGGSVSHAEIRYASDASIRIDRPSVAITTTLITGSNGDGLEVLDNSSVISHNRIIGNARNGIYIRSGTPVTVTVRDNLFQDNGTERNDAAVVADADITLLTGGNQTPDFSNKINGYLVTGGMDLPHTWLAGDLPYVVGGTLDLDERAAVLTLQPGLVVKFIRGARIRSLLGELRAGTADGEPVLMTSVSEDACSADQDTGCDTNGDGANSEPTSGDWDGIEIESDGAGAFLRNTVLRWGGGSGNGLITLAHANSTIEDCELAMSEGAGILIEQVPTMLADNYIHDNKGDGVKIEARTTPVLVTLRDNVLESNGGGAVAMDANVELVLEGHNQAVDNRRNGVTITGRSRVTHRWRAGTEDLPYILVDDVSVDDQSTLTIDPGSIIKMDFGTSLSTVRGTLIAEGTADAKIIFTSINDDSVGGNSNPHDGDVSPNAGDWRSIKFDSTGGGGSLTEAELRYGGAAGSPMIVINLEGVDIHNSLVEKGDGTGIEIESVPSDSPPEISGSTIREMRGPCIRSIADKGPVEPIFHGNTLNKCTAAIQIDADVQPDLADNDATENTVNGVLVEGTITAHRTWGAGDLVYVLGHKLSIGPGARLQMEGGTIVKAELGAELDTNRGSLVVPVQGTGGERVVFTSVRDDNYCDAHGNCDTNSDGAITVAVPGDWRGIRIGDNSTIVTLRNTGIFYGGENKAALQALGGSLVLADSAIGHSLTDGLIVSGTRATIEGSEFHDNEGAGLSLEGISTVTVDGNVFVENFRSVEHRATGDVETSNNVAVGNVHDPMLYCADVTASQTWYNDLAREIDCDVDITNGAELTIEPGAVLQMGEGESIRVADGLFAEGVAFAAIDAAAPPGFWDFISFGRQSRGFLRHSLIFFGGTSSTGVINVENNKRTQIAYNQLLRADSTGISVQDEANPIIEGNLIRQIEGRNAAAIKVEGDSMPQILRNRIAMVDIGVHMRRPKSGTIINFNNLEQTVAFGVKNDLRTVCGDAQHNWWSDSTGPHDPDDDSRDACGPGFENLEGEGVPVSDNVNYHNWLKEPPPQAPVVDVPRCGETNRSSVMVKGSTSANATVNVYEGENDSPIRSVVAESSGRFEAEVTLSAGEHRLSVDAGVDQIKSARTGFRLLNVEPSLPVDPAGIEFRYGPSGEVRQPLRDEAGCATGCGALTSGRVTLPPGEEVVVRVPITGSPGTVEFVQGSQVHAFRPASGDYWETGSFEPVRGPFTIRLSGGDDLECMGYVYPGGDGFVFGDTGVDGPPIIDHPFETADQPPLPDAMGWTGMPTWGVSDRRSFSPPYAWALSPDPDSNYPPKVDLALSYSRYMNLRGIPAPTLTFWNYYHFARGDRGYVEGRAGTDGRWIELAEFEDVSAGWKAISVPLDEFAREARFYLRFRFKSDSRDEAEGWYIDDVRVAPGGQMNGRYDEGEPLIENAAVTLRQRNPDTGRWQEWWGLPTGQINPQQTDGAGRYGFFSLPPGEYQADIVPPPQLGFAPYTSPVLVVWNGTFAHNAPLAGGAPLFLPWTAKAGRIK